MFDYDSWLESPYTDVGEPCEHTCSECDGEGKFWIEETEEFSDTEPCNSCNGTGTCEGDCEPEEPDYSYDPEG